MKRRTTILLLATGVAIGATGVALADGDGGDNGMNRFNGETWQPLDNQPAKRWVQPAQPAPTAAAPARTDHATVDANKRIHPTAPFNDNTGA